MHFIAYPYGVGSFSFNYFLVSIYAISNIIYKETAGGNVLKDARGRQIIHYKQLSKGFLFLRGKLMKAAHLLLGNIKAVMGILTSHSLNASIR